MLSEREMDNLKSLLDQAIASGQFSFGVASPFESPEQDLFNEGDRHDGHTASNGQWQTFMSVGTMDDGPETAWLKLLINQRALDYVTNGVMF